ncbi:hypothetical protein C8J57DRAFT_1306846 [Mycena rebaudengoi]|nr:hypothetical protein C8J57DRAFT_1306846 [Mycena rebaudengoi]
MRCPDSIVALVLGPTGGTTTHALLYPRGRRMIVLRGLGYALMPRCSPSCPKRVSIPSLLSSFSSFLSLYVARLARLSLHNLFASISSIFTTLFTFGLFYSHPSTSSPRLSSFVPHSLPSLPRHSLPPIARHSSLSSPSILLRPSSQLLICSLHHSYSHFPRPPKAKAMLFITM